MTPSTLFSCPRCGELAVRNLGVLDYSTDVQRTNCERCSVPIYREYSITQRWSPWKVPTRCAL